MTSKVGPKGQVVIPKAMRDRLGIEPGDEVTFVLEDGGLRLVPIDPTERLRGRFKGHDLLKILEEEHRRDVERDK